VNVSCGEEHCITCSDEATPMRVISVEPSAIARCVDQDGTSSEVMIDLVAGVAAGDVILVHAGVALAIADGTEAPA